MSFERIKERIIEKANSEASEIIKKARDLVRKDHANFLHDEESRYEESRKRSFRDLELQFKMKLDVERINLEREILIKKRNILNALFKMVEEKLLSLEDETYFNFLKNLIISDIPQGKSLIFLNKKDLQAYKKRLSVFLKKEFSSGSEYSISEKPIDIKGGCVIKGKEIEINDSIEIILEDLKEKYEISMSRELFGE
jgi:vacuolar-type H+-ATPase subunit E/Vma4